MSDDELRSEDAEARLLAQRVVDRPVHLEAGAGTGKTAVLVARICVWALGAGWERNAQRLCAGGASPVRDARIAAEVLRRIVAITFTEAAAAEMAVRVGQALLALQRGERVVGLEEALLLADAETRGRRARALIGALDQLGVRTIHAFCRRLLAGFAFDAELHPRFQVDADGAGVESVAREVMESFLRRAYGSEEGDGDALALAEAGFGPTDVEAALVKLLQEGVPAEGLADPLAPEAIASLGGALREAAAALRDAAAPLRALRRSAAVQRTLDAVEATLRELGEGPVAADALTPLCEALGRLWDPNDVGRIGNWGRARLEARASEALGDGGAACARAARAMHAWLRHVLALDPERLALGHRVLAPLLAEARGLLRRRGVETFTALLQDAVFLLGVPGVASRVRADIDQLLVDEFQDTDALQCELLRILALEGEPAERPALFLVGDPKQSIYGWRNADLRAYEAFVDAVRAAGGKKGTLSVNHRSLPAVLDEVERVIAPVMRAEPGLQPPFQRLVPDAARAGRGLPDLGAACAVEHWLSFGWKEGAGDADPAPGSHRAVELEANALARDLHRLHHEHGVAWRDVGLLFRSVADVDRYLEPLRRLGVPYVVERDRHYYDRREILDAGALVRAILDPHDQVALVAALRSSVVGVPDAAWVPLFERDFPDRFAKWLLGIAGIGEVQAAIAGAVEALPADVPGLERVRGWDRSLRAFVAAAARLRRDYEREAPDVFVERLRVALLLEASEAARTLGGFRVENLERFFRDLRTALEASAGDVADVLARLRFSVSETREIEEGRPRRADDEAVRVLTMHGAKGLEFDHVYLLQLHKGRGRARSQDAEVERRGGRIALRLFGQASLDFPAVAADADRVSEAEHVRTLYVAMTRARQRVVLVGARVGAGESHAALLEDRASTEVLRARARELHAAGASGCVDEDGVRWHFPVLGEAAVPGPSRGRRTDPEREPLRAGEAALGARRAAARARQARPLGATASSGAHELAEALASERYLGEAPEGEAAAPPDWPTPEDALSRAEARAVGTAVHAALEHADLSAAREAVARALRASLDAWLPPALSGPAQARARALVDAFVAGPLFERARALWPGFVARELPVVLPPSPGSADGPLGFVSGAIDLVYREPGTGALVVADWKTDRVAPGPALDARVRAYREQGRAYVRALRGALALDYDPAFELWFLAAGVVERAPAGDAPHG